ncbi:MAG: electron transfer flavoprotein subunit beta/FixA family protein [Deltaproteobacteria bacterium]|nr:electron transfer flavoprotein subunit beta/FixA family protein [Deltaproteobacteria bacterium]
MNSIVCVKQVASIYLQSGYDPKTKGIVSNGLVYLLNPYDEIAVEEALQQKEKSGEGEVTAITIGPARAEDALRWCLALGVDKAVHVVNQGTETLSPWETASILTNIIKDLEYDLLFFGKKAIDDEMGQVGTFVAELLDLPLVTAMTEIELLNEGRARVQRSLERGNREEVACPVPAVFTVDKTLNRPRYPTFPDRKAAETKPIQQIEITAAASDPTLPKIVTTRLAPPKLRPKKMLAPDSDMSEADQMKFIMTGGVGKKKGGAVGGDPQQIVSSIIDFLKEKNFIKD